MNPNRHLPTLSVAAAPPQEPPLISGESVQPGLSLAQVFAILWAHKTTSIAIAAVLTIIFAGLIKLLPKSYDATASIMVNYEATDPLLGEQAFPTGYMESYIATQMALIQSSSVLLPVINELDLTNNQNFIAGYKGQGSKAEWVKARLAKNISLAHPGYTQLIYISAKSNSAAEAALLANTLAKVYLSQQQERLNTPAMERAKVYSEQLAALKEKVAQAQQKVTEFRQKFGLTDLIANSTDAEITALNTLEQRYQEAINIERAALVSRNSGQDIARAAAQSPIIQTLRGQLATQQARLAEYQTTFGPNHPKVVNVKSEIESTKASLEREMQDVGKTTAVDISATRDLAAKLKPAVDAQRAKVLAVRRQQDEGSKLLLELDSAHSVYKRALEGYDKVIAAAGSQTSNLRLVNAAEIPVKSTKPNKAKLMILALAVAMFMGVVGPFAFDFIMHRKIRCRDDVERELGMPVLAEFKTCPTLANATN